MLIYSSNLKNQFLIQIKMIYFLDKKFHLSQVLDYMILQMS